jgi:hypothetical protein
MADGIHYSLIVLRKVIAPVREAVTWLEYPSSQVFFWLGTLVVDRVLAGFDERIEWGETASADLLSRGYTYGH